MLEGGDAANPNFNNKIQRKQQTSKQKNERKIHYPQTKHAKKYVQINIFCIDTFYQF